MHNLYKILQDLDLAKIHYTLGRYRDDVVTIHVTVVGQRIEIDVNSSGGIDTSIFEGDESIISGAEIINKIIIKNKD